MKPSPLSPEAARRNAQKLNDELGRVDRERLDALLGIIKTDGRINLGEALQTLYPELMKEAALMPFRQYRKRLGENAGNAGVRFFLEVDSRKKTPVSERWCWFEGEDSATETLTRLMREETNLILRTEQSGIEYRGDKQVIRYFISYSHDDDKIKEDLLQRLRKYFENDPAYIYEEWHDGLILPGDKWREQIEKAISNCQFGLLLVSSAFLASKFICSSELPAFVPQGLATPEQGKRAIPIAIEPLLLDGSMDLKGLQDLQIFLDSDRKTFTERNGTRKNEFVRQLFQKIRQVITLRIAIPEKTRFLRSFVIEQRLRHDIECALGDGCVVPPEASISTLEKNDANESGDETTRQRVDAITFITDWVSDQKAPHYFALLGELGIGKTTTCLALARKLLELRVIDPKTPLPIYMDLRLLGEKAAIDASLEEILSIVIRKKWHGGQLQIDVSPEEIVRLVQKEGALAIFDGLDEVLVHLTAKGEQRFLRELLRLLPPQFFKGESVTPEEKRNFGRLLLSCRTHYFPTLRSQKNLLLGEDRDGVAADDYRALVLLPFSEDQIVSYLKQTLKDQDPEKVLDTIRSVHNLSEMAERPYTLSLIAREIPQIERWKMEGRTVTGVTLYRHMVQSWLERDAGKHTISTTHKQRIMEYFAAELWRSGRRSWCVEDVEQWLIDFLRSHPEIAAHYDGKDRELLKEDLRTATFLVREGEDQFRFAHTSLLEFFLACHLHRGLMENNIERWCIPMVSRETYGFLGQLLTEGEGSQIKALATLRRLLREEYLPKGSEQALAYALLAHEKGHPSPVLASIRMEGADLRGWKFYGKPEAKLNLRGSSWLKANLDGATFHHADMEGADFTEVSISRGELINCRLGSSLFVGAQLAGTIFRESTLVDVDFSASRCHRTKWLYCDLKGAKGVPDTSPKSFLAQSIQLPDNDICMNVSSSTGLTVETFDGHSFGVRALAYAPDGQRLASASYDGTVRVWDVESGECLAVLTGHEDQVNEVAYSPNGRRLASASHDSTVRVWNIESGECLAVLAGHNHWISSVAYAPDGRRLASASGDKTVRVWDVESGECLTILTGHEDQVNSVAYSPNGRRLASASQDKTVRIWDVESGECLTVLAGHKESVTAAAYAPDGRRLASASEDSTVRVWDVESGECLAVLAGHEFQVNDVAYAPDGQQLASASRDKTVRIWDVESEECLAVLAGHEEPVNSAVYAPDGRRLASASSDKTVRVWDVESEECLAVLSGHEVVADAVAYAPDGHRLASASGDSTVRVWDVESGECLAVLAGHKKMVNSVAYAPDGRRLASASGDSTVRVWDVESGECLAVLAGHGVAVNSVAYAPDGKRLASAAHDNTVRVWDVENGECLTVLTGHKKTVNSVAYAPDGQRLASASYDGTVRVWDVESGECLTIMKGHTDWVNSVAYAPDGQQLSSASWDGSLRKWDITSGSEIHQTHFFKGGAWVTLDVENNSIVQVAGNAWRWIGWSGIDQATGCLERWPAEIYGPLPEWQSNKN